jgi:endonuclease/exonuclease/phosphatase family metal-dependent hydrolase
MLKIATINTWKCKGNYERRIALLAEKFKKEKYDILCCQESFRTIDGKYDTARTLAANLGMTYTFSAARQKKRMHLGKKIDSVSGLAILTGPETCMINSGSFPIPENSKDKDSVAQFAVIQKNGNGVLIINLCLSCLQNKKTLRHKQLQIIFSHSIMEKQFAAILICGDFDAKPGNEELSFLKKQPGFKVRDCFIEGGGNPRVSALLPKYDIAEEMDGQHIDHIFVLQKKTRPVAKMAFGNSRIILDQSDGEILMPSNHFGIALDLTLSRVKRDPKSQIYRYASFAQSWRKSPAGTSVFPY